MSEKEINEIIELLKNSDCEVLSLVLSILKPLQQPSEHQDSLS